MDMTISEETLNKLHCPSEGSLSDLEASQNSLSTSGTQLASSEYLISDVLLICRGISKEPGISWAPPLDHKLYPQIVEEFYNQMLSSPKRYLFFNFEINNPRFGYIFYENFYLPFNELYVTNQKLK